MSSYRRLEPRGIVKLQYRKKKPSSKGEGEFLFTRAEIFDYMMSVTGRARRTVMNWWSGTKSVHALKNQYFPKPPTTKAACENFLRQFHRGWHGPGIPSKFRSTILHLTTKGWSAKEIAASLGCSVFWVYEVRRQNAKQPKDSRLGY